MNNKPLLMLLTVAVATASALFFHPMEEAMAEKQTAGTAKDYAENASTDNQRQMELPARLKGVPEQIIRHTGFTLSFNREHNNPNWVAWELTASEASAAGRREDNFLPDPEVAAPHQVTTADYKGSGYDRGHMAPAADMKWSKKAMQESFFLTNICPQNHSLNSGGWKRLEEKVRLWADRDSAVIVVSGPIVQGHINRLESGVAVPTGFFKVLLAPFATPKRAIAFIYKNEGGQKVIERQAVSVDEVEALTGFDFFSSLPDEEENEIEKTCDYYEWNN